MIKKEFKINFAVDSGKKKPTERRTKNNVYCLLNTN